MWGPEVGVCLCLVRTWKEETCIWWGWGGVGWNLRLTPSNWVTESSIRMLKINFCFHKAFQATFIGCPLYSGHYAKPWGELPRTRKQGCLALKSIWSNAEEKLWTWSSNFLIAYRTQLLSKGAFCELATRRHGSFPLRCL